MRRVMWTVLTAAALVLSGCGDDDDDTDTTTDASEDTDDSSDSGAAAVTIAGFAFEPSTIEVLVGEEISWTNDDGATHTVTSGEPGSATGKFDASVSSGSEITFSLDEPGTFAYFCSIHPSMTAEIVVT